jgi:hypothetical protein
MAEVMRFLDKMDDTREMRTQDRPEIWQMDGFRSEWSSYMNEWIDDNADWG